MSAAAYALFRSMAMAAGIMVGGVLIDLDHFFEYFFHRGIRLDIQELFHLSYNNLFPKIFILFHSYEILIGIWLIYWLGFRNGFLLGLAVGFTAHMIFDQIFNSARAISYFFIYRAANRFDAGKLYRPGTVVGAESQDSPIRPERDL